MHGLEVQTANELLLLDEDRRLGDLKLAAATEWILTADLWGQSLPTELRERRDAGSLTLAQLLRPFGPSTGIDGNRIEVALMQLLQRPSMEGDQLRRYLLGGMLTVTDNPEVQEAIEESRDRLEVVAISREKRAGSIRGNALVADYRSLLEAMHADAKVVVPHKRGAYVKLLPAVDRRSNAEATRLYALLETPFGKPLTGMPDSVAFLHHADLLIGTGQGRFWFGVDVKTARQGGGRREHDWPGIALHIDVRLDGTASKRSLSPTGHPLVTISANDTAFAFVSRAQRVLEQVYAQPTSARVYGADEESRLIRDLLPLRDESIDRTFDLLQRRAGVGLVLPTEQDVHTYGDITSHQLAFGGLAN